jgi:hypothetical protein
MLVCMAVFTEEISEEQERRAHCPEKMPRRRGHQRNDYHKADTDGSGDP